VTTDHGVVETVLDRSIATKSDIGRSIDLAEACKTGVCHYGKATGGGWQFHDSAVRIVGRGLLSSFWRGGPWSASWRRSWVRHGSSCSAVGGTER
jgi:hypothetical protein